MRIGYARASTVRQSLDTQADSLRAAGVTRIFAEKISTRAVTRPELDKAVALAREMRASGVAVTLVVHEHKRLGRGIELAALAEQLRAAGIGLEFLTGELQGSHDPSGVVFTVLAALSGMEREYIRDRTLEGHESARARGKAIGGAAVTDDAMLAVGAAPARPGAEPARHRRPPRHHHRQEERPAPLAGDRHAHAPRARRERPRPAVPATLWLRWSLVIIVGSVGVAQVADGPGGQVRKNEAVGAVDAEVPADERGKPGHVLLEHRVALGPELADGGIEVDGRPQDDAIQDKAERAELVLQAALVAVVQLAFLPVADLPGQGVAAFCRLRMPLMSRR